MASFSKGKGKRPPSPRLVAICDIQSKMLDGYFEERVMNRDGSFDHPGSKYKYVHVDLCDSNGFSTITLSAADGYVHQLSSKLHVGMFIRVTNFSVYLKNGMFEHGDCSHNLRVGPMTVVETVPPFSISVSFLPTHTIEDFLGRECLNELGTLELVVVGILGRANKQFILLVADSCSSVHSFVFNHEFYSYYLLLAEAWSKGEVTTFQIKNATSASHGENYLSTTYSSIIVTPVAEIEVHKNLTKIFEFHTLHKKSVSLFEVSKQVLYLNTCYIIFYTLYLYFVFVFVFVFCICTLYLYFVFILCICTLYLYLYLYFVFILCIYTLCLYFVFVLCIYILYLYTILLYCICMLYSYVVFIYCIHILYLHTIFIYYLCILFLYTIFV
jgi:hypothetical protein